MFRNLIILSAWVYCTILAAQTSLIEVNGESINLEDFVSTQKNNLRELGVQKSIDIFTEFELLEDYAIVQGAEEDVVFLTQYNKALGKLREEELISPKKIDSALAVWQNRLQYEYKVQIIYAPAKYLKTINNAIKNNVSFASLVNKYSESKAYEQPTYLKYAKINSKYWPIIENLSEGEVSEPIKEKNYYVWIKMDYKRPNLGMLQLQYISNARKESIDSAYNAVKSGTSFDKTFLKYSESGKNIQGYLGNVFEGLDSLVYNQVKNIPINGITAPFLQDSTYYIYKVISKTPFDTNTEKGKKVLLNIFKETPDYYDLLDENYDKVNDYPGFVSYDENIKNFIKNGADYFNKALGYEGHNLPLFRLNDFEVDESQILQNLRKSGAQVVDSTMISMVVAETMHNAKQEFYENNLFFQQADIRPKVAQIKKSILINYAFDQLILKNANTDYEGMKKFIASHPEKYTFDERADIVFFNTTSDEVAKKVKKALKKKVPEQEIVDMFKDKVDSKNRPFVYTESGKLPQNSVYYPLNVPFKPGIYVLPAEDNRVKVVQIKSILPKQLMTVEEAKVGLLEVYQNEYYKNLLKQLKSDATIVINQEAVEKLKQEYKP